LSNPPEQPTRLPLAPDPFEFWRQIYEANERAWNASLERAMGTPAFAEAQGKLLETILSAQKTTRDSMRTYLEAINVPTREDIARLGEMIAALEEKIDQLDDRLEARLERFEAALERADARAGLEARASGDRQARSRAKAG
jgi:polyhydroxyalkanoic acid synthase PhaR subunit